MNNIVSWFASLIAALIPLLLKAEDQGGTGADKKARVTAEILAHLKDPKVPIHLPTWLPESVVGWVISLLVDLLVTQLNKLAFFNKS